ncbi:protein regulator of cytokinesis 1b isoform X2 [Engraulis encrasicolus]|uniref:protein regulator of cytokinesis 1b isoform X2 n=1 Tax=Engraulis encrasicolus TaxID=184585 RepID=UPI002FD1C1F5
MRKSEVLAAESVACLNKALCRLKDIWEEIGIPEDQRLERTNVVKNHIQGLLDMMISEEESLRQRLMDSIASCRKDLQKLSQELQLPAFEEDYNQTMLHQEKSIRTQVSAMIEEKSQRMRQLKSLSDQDQDLCDLLCTEPFPISSDRVPSTEQLDTYRQHIIQLSAERDKRRSEFMKLKQQIVLCMEDLEQLPETSFEKDVVCEDEDAFCLSQDNINSLKLLLHQLENRKAENEAVCATYRQQIQQLWERLQTPQEERDAMSTNMRLSKKRNMDALQVEVVRLETLKRQNICSLVTSIREEMAALWDKCFYSDEQRQEFMSYQDDDFTEDLLSAHDSELLHLRQHYESHKELFEGIYKWEESWRLYLDSEKKASDPSRFTNRGGNLLKEEKQRSDLQKSLPKLEKKLKAQIDQWEQEQSCEFLVKGRKFMEYVSEQWEQHRLDKEREKQERHLKKSKQIEEEMLYGTSTRSPCKRRFLGPTTTPGKTRKLNGTSALSAVTTNSTRFGGTVCHSPVARPPIKVNGPRTPVRGKQQQPRELLRERNKENLCLAAPSSCGGSTKSVSPQPNASINSVASTYSEFARDLSKMSKSKCVAEILSSTITPP